MLKLRGLPRDYRVVWGWTCLIGAIQSCWALAFIYRTSFVVEGRRYFCLFDDAMISMRYASNWAAGYGLVWNPGERVEGYTNFLWTMVMGLCHLLPLSRSHLCLVIQLLGIPILWACLFATVALAGSCRLLAPTAIIAVTLPATFYNLAYYTLTGMETGLATCLILFGLAHAIRSMHAGRASIANALWFAPAILARPDSIVLAVFVLGFLLLRVRAGRGRLITGVLILGLVLLVHLLWRHSFYGDWAPNTYYLKMTHWPLSRRLGSGLNSGALVVCQLFLPMLFAFLALLSFRGERLLLAGAFALGVLYHVYVGGDAWGMSRFTIPATPALFVLTALGIRELTSLLSRSRAAVRIAAACLILGCVINLNGVHFKYWFLMRSPQTVGGNKLNIQTMHAINRIADPDASVAVAWAGSIPYFSGRKSFDILGKCDPVIARLPAMPESDRPGHNKLDMDYVTRVLQPDLVLHCIDTTTPSFTREYTPVEMEVDGTLLGFSIRKGTPRVWGGRPIRWRDLANLVRVE